MGEGVRRHAAWRARRAVPAPEVSVEIREIEVRR
jgi:hypothetical protein